MHRGGMRDGETKCYSEGRKSTCGAGDAGMALVGDGGRYSRVRQELSKPSVAGYQPALATGRRWGAQHAREHALRSKR